MNLIQGTRTRTRQTHSAEIDDVYGRVLNGTSVHGRFIAVDGHRVHLLEKGAGQPVVLLHGGGNPAGFFMPLLNELEGLRVLAPDLPGIGLSDPIDRPRPRYRTTAVEWLDRMLDTFELDTTVLVGHSGGGMWALWYALAHPERVDRLVLIEPPALPKTRMPLPVRLISTPLLGGLLSRLMPPTRKSVLQFARIVAREGETLARYPELVDLLVAAGRDPVTDRTGRAEVRAHCTPFTVTGTRRRSRIGPAELRQIAMPTLLIWGEREAIGNVSVAQEATHQVPRARLVVMPTGHGPWLGQPAETAAAITDFVR